ncbi:MAG: heme biosynthesis HemY N-terminal domain-containing protein [Formosimonas sp.]
MRQAIWTFILLLIAGAIAYASRHYPGSAEFIVAGLQVRMSIYVFALLFLGLFAVTLLFWRVYRAVVNAPSRYGAWREHKREDRALASVKVATIALHEGRFAHADKAAKIASRSPQSAGLAALLGAASAQAQGQNAAAQTWLKTLDDDADFSDSAALQRAQMALDAQDATGALAALDAASATVRKHSERFRELQVQAHAAAGHWHEVLQIAKDPKWHVSLSVKNQWFARAAQALCSDATVSTAYVQSLYKDMPDAVRADDAALLAYVNGLLQRNEPVLASRAIEQAMRISWRPRLLDAYVAAASEPTYTAQLKMLDEWASAHPKDAALNCAAGQLCLKAQLWGRAKVNFQTSLAAAPSVAAHFGLAQTYRALDDVTHAQIEERKAAELAARVCTNQ